MGSSDKEELEKVIMASLHSKPVAQLKADIERFMFLSEKHPLVMTSNSAKFKIMMDAFYNYEKAVKKESSSDFGAAVMKLKRHMATCFESDFLFYILLIYRIHKKLSKYACEHARDLITSCMYNVEHKLRATTDMAKVLQEFVKGGDFEVSLKLNSGEEKKHSVFLLLEKACFELADVSYTTHMRSAAGMRKLMNGKEYLYKNFVFSRMLWVSIAMKFHGARGVPLKVNMKKKWEDMFSKFRSNIIFDRDTCAELSDGLEIGRLLELPDDLAFNYQHLSSMLFPETKVRPFYELRNCLEKIEGFLSNDKLLSILANLRLHYSSLWEESVEKRLKSVSLSGTLHDSLAEGIKYLNCIHSMYVKREVNQQFVDSQIHHWLKLLLLLVDIKSPNATVYMAMFLKHPLQEKKQLPDDHEPAVKKYRHISLEYFAKTTRHLFPELNVQQFYNLHVSFEMLLCKEDLRNYLMWYRIPMDINLGVSTWSKLLREVVNWFQSAHQHSFLVEFFKKAGKVYEMRKESLQFVTDLLKLRVRDLLSLENEHDQESSKVKESFSRHLHVYINKNSLHQRLLPEIKRIFKHISGDVDKFQWLVLDVVCRETIFDLRSIRSHKIYFEEMRDLLTETLIPLLCFDHSWVTTLSTQQRFCWQILSTCCSKIIISYDNFKWAKRYGSVIQVMNLSSVFSSYCTAKQLTGDNCIIVSNFPKEIRDHQSEDVHRYFEWVAEIHGVLLHWNNKFSCKDITYQEMQQYPHHDNTLKELGCQFNASSLLMKAEDVKSYISAFDRDRGNLNALLLRHIPSQANMQWCTLIAVLNCYDVYLPPEAEEIMSKVNFPTLETDPSGKTLQLNDSMTLLELSNLVLTIKIFLEPIDDFLNMLVFFKLTKSALFDIYRDYYMKKLEAPQDALFLSKCTHSASFSSIRPPPTDFFSSSLTIAKCPASCVLSSSEQDSVAKDCPMKKLKNSLQSIYNLLDEIMKGSAKYSDIVAEDEESLKGLDMEKEFAVLLSYAQMENLPGSGLQGVRSMLEIFQCTTLVKNISLVCDQYHLEECKKDRNLKKVLELTQGYAEKRHRFEITPLVATDKMEKVKRILCISESRSLKCLDIFEAVLDSAAFYQFVKKKQFFDKQGQNTFQDLYMLITAQLMHEKYNEDVLNHLLPAFKVITPFMSADKSFVQLMKEVTSLNAENSIEQLKTVNTNIMLIRLWFHRAEGNTLKNVVEDLHCIIKTGHYTFCLGSSNLHVSLEYQPSSIQMVSSPLEREPQFPKKDPVCDVCKETWNSEQIEDFIRNIGFTVVDDEYLKKHGFNVDRGQIENFQYLNQMLPKLLKLYQTLYELGHDHYVTKNEVPCCMCKEDVNKMVQELQTSVIDWKKKVTQLRADCTWLLYFSIPKILLLYEIMRSSSPDGIEKTVQEVSVLTINEPLEGARLREIVQGALTKIYPQIESEDATSPMLVVGQFLNILFQTLSPQKFLVNYFQQKSDIANQPLYYCPSSSQVDHISLILNVFSGSPQPYQMLHCRATTTEEELGLFLKRVEKHPAHYLMLAVNELPFKLQEVLVKAHFDMQRMRQHEQHELPIIHFVETIPSMLREIPWMELQDTKPSVKKAKEMCARVIFESHNFTHIQCVYGLTGSGKTHYAKKCLSNCPKQITIAVNETFSVLGAITRLRSLSTSEKNIGLFFNFTILPPDDSSEKTSYLKLLDTIGWFFFNLFLLGYVEDTNTGLSYCLPRGMEWVAYIEVPSQSDKNAAKNLALFYHDVPVLQLIRSLEYYIDPGAPYDVNSDVQLVCKYLQAYKKGKIDRQYQEHGPLVKFSRDDKLSDKACHELLKEYMPEHVAQTKLTQKLFIKYMKRRCYFLDNLSHYNYNYGRSAQWTGSKKEKKVHNTEHLGSTLMKAMLSEVSEFCNPRIKGTWSLRPHQQLIYEFKDGGLSLGLIFLRPDKLSKEQKTKFEDIGIDIPSTNELSSRELLDSYLSRALNVELENNRLSVIDDDKYVLTLDYTLKMLNIHERYKCEVPVIIEGETGVGKTALVEMLSKLWNQSLQLKWKREQSRLVELVDTFIKELRAIPGGSETIPADQVQRCLQITEKLFSREVSIDELQFFCSWFYIPLRKHLFHMRNNLVVPSLVEKDVPEMGRVEQLFDLAERENSPEAISRLLNAILIAEVKPTFHKINVHAAMTPSEVESMLEPIFSQANALLKIHQQIVQRMKAAENNPTSPSSATCEWTPVTVFLDEINTSSCSGIFKELIVDRSFGGKAIPDNVFIVAACNPHRSNSLASHKSWVRGTYYVHPLHPTLKFLMWDYGSLDKKQEKAYTKAKMKMINSTMSNLELTGLTNLIIISQEKMRDFAYKQIKEILDEKNTDQADEKAKILSRSCVSQRDIQRVFTFYRWFKDMYDELKPHGKKCDNYHRRAVLVALGLVYYMRLNAKFREEYRSYLDKADRELYKLSFSDAFKAELKYFIRKVELPKGIACTLALKENLFAIIICTANHIPLIIVGDPGSSKTLSFNLAIANLKGLESKVAFFRRTELFPSLDPHCYQCSRRTTSNEIQTVFSHAINRQRSHKQSNFPTNCVVFMDEAGLPEESHESLKVLHYHLDEQEVSFVAITNHVLDAAKTNRAVSLFRPEASEKDLKTLAKGCLCPNPDKPPPELSKDLDMVERFSGPYLKCMKTSSFSNFFGLRDFIQFVNYFRRKRDEKGSISLKMVVHSLERNFGGSDEFDIICKKFLEQVPGVQLQDFDKFRRPILEVLQRSMQDRPQALQDFSENAVRYKMIIDPSDDGSLVRLLFSFKVLDRENTRVFVCSDFPGDGQLQKINTIAAIRHSAMEGHTVVMYQTDDLHESFYNLFNQRFQCINDPKHGARYYTNIAIGSHSKPSRVHPNFQCVVVVKKSEVDLTPGPFLNRFEKYLISHGNLLEKILRGLPPCIAIIIESTKSKVNGFIHDVCGSNSFFGLQHETLDSLILDILPEPLGYRYQDLDECCGVGNSQTPLPEYLLENILHALRSSAGFYIPRYDHNDCELKMDTEHVFGLIESDPKFKGLLKTMTHEEAVQAVAEAFNTLHTAPGPKRQGKQLDLTPEGSLVVSLVQQLLIRLLTKRLINLMPAEAVVLNRKKIPYSYLKNYLRNQAHFSLKKTIEGYSKALNATYRNSSQSPNKVLCFTRSSPLVHQLPTRFPLPMMKEIQQSLNPVNKVRNLVFEDTDKLIMCKLSSLQSQSSVQELLRDFVSSETAEVCVLLADMQETTQKTINHIRVMIEEAELTTSAQHWKVFVLLLHFPPAQFFQHCYPTLFLKGWDHCYLDTVGHNPAKEVVDIRDWFFKCCFPAEPDPGPSPSHSPESSHNEPTPSGEPILSESGVAVSEPTIPDEGAPGDQSSAIELRRGLSDPAYSDALVHALSQLLPQIMSLISSRVQFECSRNQNEMLKTLLEQGLGKILCDKFQVYWTPKVMAECLERAATFSQKRESTLNITDTIQTQFRALFVDFCVYMLTQANSYFSLASFYAEDPSSSVRAFFTSILKIFPVPELNNLIANNPPSTPKLPMHCHFPFFTYIYELMEKEVELCRQSGKLQHDLRVDHNLQTSFLHAGSSVEELMPVVLSTLEPLLESKVCSEQILSIAVDKMASDQGLWEHYFTDFITHKLKLVGPDPYPNLYNDTQDDDIAQKVWHTYFEQLHKREMPQRLVELHCYANIYHVYLAKMAIILHPLEKIERLQEGKEIPSTFSPIPRTEELLAAVRTTSSPLGSPYHLSNFVINTLFNALEVSMSGQTQEKLAVWFESYRDIVSLPTLKHFIYISVSVSLSESATAGNTATLMERMINIMHTIFVTMQAFPAWDEDTLSNYKQIFHSLFTQCFYEDSDNWSSDRLSLEKVVNTIIGVLPRSLTVILNNSPFTWIMEGLLAHFFSPGRSSYATEDVRWLLKFANAQNQWCHLRAEVIEMLVGVVAENAEDDPEAVVYQMNTEPLHGTVGLNTFKLYLSRILGKNAVDSDKYYPLLRYCVELRTLIGEVLMSEDLGPPGPYLPLFCQIDAKVQLVENNRMQQPLGHLYFLTVIENDNLREKNLDTLVGLASHVKEKFENAIDGEAVLLQLEFQAILQVLTQQLASHLDSDMLGDVDTIEIINSLTEGQDMVLALQLMKILKSSRKFTNLMTERYENVKIVRCLDTIHHKLQVQSAQVSKTEYPSFLGDQKEVKLLYKDVLASMISIHKGKSGGTRDLCQKAQICKEGSVDKWNDFKMVLWLATYYYFYDKKIKSPKLCDVVGGAEMANFLDENYVYLIKCFLHPTPELQHKESTTTLTERQVLEGGVDGVHQDLQHEEHMDPLYQLFFLDDPDQFDDNLRCSLANLVAAIVGSPSQSNHLWYHLFAADKLENSFIAGFMYDATVHCGGLMYDCGVKLSPMGLFSRCNEKHGSQSTYTLHSLYLLLWANFGSFCMALLTQPDSDKHLRGHILSEKLSLRHYCLSQLKIQWKNICNTIALSEEQTLCFIIRAMTKLRKLSYSFQPSANSDTMEPYLAHGIFKTRVELDSYEKMWHKEIFQATWGELPTMPPDGHQNELFKDISRLDAHYPHFLSQEELTHCILSGENLLQHPELHFLSRFAMEWPCLQVGGELLPELVDFYQWLHTDIAHLLTRDQASTTSIGEVITRVEKNSGKVTRDRYERVKKNYNEYVRLTGIAEPVAKDTALCCGNRRFTIADDIHLIHFLTDAKEEGDWLYTVLADVISTHNWVIKKAYSVVEQRHPSKHLLPKKPSKIFATVMSIDNTIAGNFPPSHGAVTFQEMVRSWYKPTLESLAGSSMTPRCQISAPQLKKLEDDVVFTFVAGKSLIEIPSKFREVAIFKEDQIRQPLQTYTPCTSRDLHNISQQLPETFKVRLPDDLKKRLEYAFLSAGHNLMIEVVMALKTIIGRLIKALDKGKGERDYSGMTAEKFMQDFCYEMDKGVFYEIGVRNASSSCLGCLTDLPLSATYSCLELFFRWVDEGFYDYNMVPFSFKKHLNEPDRLVLEQLIDTWTGTKSELETELQILIDALKQCEQFITSEVNETMNTPICDYLIKHHSKLEDKLISQQIPQTIMLHHYMEFRLTLRRLHMKVEQETAMEKKASNSSSLNLWSEFVSDLWKNHLPHFREILYGDGSFVFNPTSGYFGFQEENRWVQAEEDDAQNSVCVYN